MSKGEMLAARKKCTRFLSHRHPSHRQPQHALAELAQFTGPELDPDNYGKGEVIEGFEAEVALLLGKKSAAFMPSGTMAQQIALRIWANRRGTRLVAFHPTSHLELHEERAYEALHGLRAVLVGSQHRLLTLDDLKQVAEPLGAILLELPQREIGGQLPEWDDLCAIVTWGRENCIPLHMDGARLWECQPFYGRSYAEIAGLFDSVYVSFNKGLGGIAGSILAGPCDFIAESRIWQKRHGGALISLYPYVLSARKGLVDCLARMGDYHEKAIEVAAVLASFPEIDVVPCPPHTNMMHVYIRGDLHRLERAAFEIANELGTYLFDELRPTPLPTEHKFELTVNEATLELSNEEIAAMFHHLLSKAGARGSAREKTPALHG